MLLDAAKCGNAAALKEALDAGVMIDNRDEVRH